MTGPDCRERTGSTRRVLPLVRWRGWMSTSLPKAGAAPSCSKDLQKQFSTGGTYINFLTEDEGPQRIRAALGNGLDRLGEVKADWDPMNMFRTNRNIIPA